MVGLTERVLPVHASSAFLCANFQSDVPSNCKIAKVVKGERVDIKAFAGEVDVIRWYRNGIPTSARRTGLSNRSVDTVPLGSPAKATNVPRRVYRSWEGERLTKRSEYGLPMTSNEASETISECLRETGAQTDLVKQQRSIYR